MKNYSIVKIGNEYVVRAHQNNILKVTSRRNAARLVTDAAELLNAPTASNSSPETRPEPSIARDPGGIADPKVISDLPEVP